MSKQDKMLRQAEKAKEEKTPEPAKFTNVIVRALVCPCCGRGMSPRVIKTDGNRKRLLCSACGKQFTAIYVEGNEQPSYVRA